jgi:serine/threonine protein kinase
MLVLMNHAPALRVGVSPLPGYELRRFLGRGGFGEVWEATGPDGAALALKFLPCKDSRRASHETRSIQAVRRLAHPNLVQVSNIWSHLGYLVIAMELADGTLHELQEAYLTEFGTSIPPEELCPLLAQAAEALDFLNARQHHVHGRRVGLQHCDVKPSNLLLFGEEVKLSDFSLTSPTTSAVRRHRRAGTPYYTAPEVVQGFLSNWTDQYALAVTYCQLRGGRLPFSGAPAAEGGAWPAPELTMVPENERPIIGRALSAVPQDPWRSCGELIDQLQQQTSGPAGPLRPNFGPGTRRGGGSAASERRVAVRQPCRIQTTGCLLGEMGPDCWDAHIRDVSKTGLALLTGMHFERGTILAIKLEDRKRSMSRKVYVRVVSARRQPSGDWLLGGKFVRPLNDADLQGLL